MCLYAWQSSLYLVSFVSHVYMNLDFAAGSVTACCVIFALNFVSTNVRWPLHSHFCHNLPIYVYQLTLIRSHTATRAQNPVRMLLYGHVSIYFVHFTLHLPKYLSPLSAQKYMWQLCAFTCLYVPHVCVQCIATYVLGAVCSCFSQF